MQKVLLYPLFFFFFFLGYSQNDFALRINTGGSEIDYDGETFIADTFFDIGSTLDRPQTGLPEPYKTFRFSRSQQMGYDIPVPDGEYTVNLHFAELWFGATDGGTGGAGKRVFDVTMEGQLVEDNLDIFAEVGAEAMLVKSYTITVSGGVLDIDFDSRDIVGGERHPVINAIEILGNETAFPPITVDPIADQSNLINDSVSLSAMASGGDPNLGFTYDISGQPLGLSINQTTGEISGMVDANAATGGPNNDGIYQVTVAVGKSGSQDISTTFNWTITDPSCTWTSLSDSFIERFEAVSQKVGDKLYVLGGFKPGILVVAETEIYDTTTDVWSIGASMPLPVTHTAAVAVGTDIWIIAGFAGDNPGVATDVVQIYNTLTDSWSNGPNLPNPVGSGAATLNGNKIYFVGGLLPDRQTDVADHLVLDLDNLTAGWTMAAPMPDPRNHHSYINVNGINYAIGGQFGHDGGKQDVDLVHAYDPTTDQWTRKTDLARPRSHFKAATTIHNGKIIIAGGVDGDLLPDEVSQYDPQLDLWTELCRLPTGLEEAAAQAFGDRLIVSGGRPIPHANILLKETKWLPLEPDMTEPPVADAGLDQSITLPTNSLVLNGAGYDPDGGTINFQWTQESGPNTANMSAADTADLSTSNLVEGDYVFRLTVADDENETAFDEVMVTVNPESRPFITTWKTDNPGVSNNNQITIPTYPGETYNYSVDWGDGSSDSGVTGNITHTYANPGTYQVSISGKFPRIYFNNGFDSFIGDDDKIISIDQWGSNIWRSMQNAFAGCFNLDLVAEDVPNLSEVSDMRFMFMRCPSLVANSTIGEWNLSNVTTMRSLFEQATSFNRYIGDWDVSKVTNIAAMFQKALTFNQDISKWDVSNVENMSVTFASANSFNHNISNWDVSNVRILHGTFANTDSFNQDLSDWNVSSVIDMRSLFSGATSFDQDLSNWDVSKVTSMVNIFANAVSFNGLIGNWDISNVSDLRFAFYNAHNFNQDIGRWDVSKVESMHSMFDRAGAFDQDISEWDISSVTEMDYMFANSGISQTNYDNLLVGWSGQQLQSSVIFDGGNSQFCLGEDARQKLIDDFGWIITDGGKAADCPDPNDFALRINTGGTEVDYNGETFVGDIYFDTGLTLDRPQTGLPEPYKTFRFSRSQQMSYDIPIPDGEYIVNLHFAELWFGATGGGSGGVGSRVFDVMIEGQLAEDNLDVFSEVGADAMLIKSHRVTVSGGVLDIDFDSRDIIGGERHPVINAIEILGAAPEERPFITTWKTDNPGASNDDQITIPTHPNETYNYVIEWGDGTSDSGVTGNITHTYATPGTYEVSISGEFPSIFFNDPFNGENGDADKILSIDQWGNIVWKYAAVAYAGCDNLDIKATDIPDFSNIIYTNAMFHGCKSLVGNSTMNSWDFSSVVSMNSMFADAILFNQHIGQWDVGNVTDFGLMFSNATSFDQDIGGWNVTMAENFNGMLAGAISFDQNLENWNVGGAQNLGGMFSGAGLSLENYDKLLVGWANLPTLQNNLTFDAGNSVYCVGQEARQKLIDDFGWEIMDGGRDVECPDTTSFITTWKTDNLGPSDDNQISIPTRANFTYNYNVDWGDGTTDIGVTGNITHTYAVPGTYQIAISGQFPSIHFAYGDQNDFEKIISVDQWGDLQWQSMSDAFRGCKNLDVKASDTPDLSIVFSTSGMFLDCESLIGNDNFNSWDVSNVRNMSLMFTRSSFNQEINDWDVSNVTNMNNMFSSTTEFNQDIGDWNVSKVTDMAAMFGNSSFNQNIGSWDVGSVTTMHGMFNESPFNQDIGNWDVRNVVKLNYMFYNNSDFNQNIGTWDTSSVTEMDYTFEGATSFNQDISNWDVSNVTSMLGTFFKATSFNQDISNWDVSGVTDMRWMFNSAGSFDQDLSSWNVGNVTSMANMFKDIGLSIENYDRLLNGWGDLPVQNSVIFDGGTSQYCQGHEARQKLIDDFGWTITDGGKTIGCLDGTSFITTWKTDNPGASNNNQITIPTYPGETYNYSVDWGDGTSDSGVTGDITHTYAVPGTYQVSISEEFPGIFFNFNQDNDKILSVNQWGNGKWKSMDGAFNFCRNIDLLATDIPDLEAVGSMRSMFGECEKLVGNDSFNEWDVSSVTDMGSMFAGAVLFNRPIDEWDVSSVENMVAMFVRASSFNQPIGSWNVSNVNDMNNLFLGAGSFNQSLENWDVSNVTSMSQMFENALSFDQDLANWDVSNVTNMFEFLKGTSISVSNYDTLLLSWSELQDLKNDVIFDGGNSQYCQGEEARQKLIDDFGWIITDGGKAADCPEPNDFALRINTGGTGVDYNGETFIGDTYFDTGLTLDRPQTGLPEPYQTFRYSRSQQMGYDIPIPDGEYTVNLHFAELWFGATDGGTGGAGKRVFDVSIEGQLVEDDLDIFAEVGAETMLIKAYTVTVSGGVLDIDFDSRDIAGGERHPVINAIEILGGNSGGSGKLGIGKKQDDNDMIIYPNQVSDFATVSFEKTTEVQQVYVFDITGRLIKSYHPKEIKNGDNYIIDVNLYQQGPYIIKLIDSRGVNFEKQMIVKKE